MASIKITELGELTQSAAITSNDVLQIINIEETSSSYPTGTNKKVKASTLANGLAQLSTVIPPVIQTALNNKVSLENFNNAGLKIAVPVVAASPGINLTLANLIPGASLDGVTLASGNRILLKDQTLPAQNGIYVIQTSGAPIRATDFDTPAEINSCYVLVSGGNTLRGSGWVATGSIAIVGTDPITFIQFSSAITNVDKTTIGLGNVDNTSDANKPISTLTQTALNSKQGLIIGAATTVITDNLTADRALLSSATGKIAVSSVTSTELGHLSGVSSAIQTQLNTKANLNGPQFTGNVSLPSTTTVNSVSIGSFAIPAGAIMPFAMSTAPSGWLAANGSTVSRTTYSDLFAAIGTTYGVGNGSTTFTLPDLRGLFIRGTGTSTVGTTSYTGGAVGTRQGDEFKSHSHKITKPSTIYVYVNDDNSYNIGGGFQPAGARTPAYPDANANEGGAETRPANISLLYCIKI